MGTAPAFPRDESERLGALRALRVLDTPAEERFDRITRVAARAFGVPIVLVSLVDSNRQWFKACIGIDDSELPREYSFCGHAILEDDMLVIPDALADVRFAANPLVTGPPKIRFYAGQPLRAPSNHKIGTLCVIDCEPRGFDERDRTLLRDLARMVEVELANVELANAVSARREGEDLIRAILLAVDEGVVGMDLDGGVVFANPAAERMLGWREEEMIGRRGHEVYHHSHPDGSPYPWQQCPSLRAISHAEVVRLDDTYWRRDGSSFPCEAVTAPLRRNGEVIGAVSSFIDRSEREAVDRLKNEFASVVGHELRTPLTSIRASLGLLGGGVFGALGDEAGKMVETAIANTDRLDRLINDILDLERLEAGASPLEAGVHACEDLIGEATAVVGSLAADAGVELVAGSGSAKVRADGDRVVQTLVNLVGNAIKFSAAGDRVMLATERVGDDVVMSVTDNGRGIPAERQEVIFERFAQVDASDARHHGGTGLGLAIAREVVELHGGRIWVVSAPDEGSTFSFTLPAVDE